MAKSTKPSSATSYKDTSFGIISRTKLVTLEEEGVKRALTSVLHLAATKQNITPTLILDLHREGFAFIFPQWAGKYRTIEVTVGAYTPPPAHLVPELIKNLCDDLEERLRHIPSADNQDEFLAVVISLLAWFQHRFVWIHPFQDYNGRVGRLLTNLLALRLGLPLFEIKADTKRDRERYITAMKRADKQEYALLEDLLAETLQESLQQA